MIIAHVVRQYYPSVGGFEEVVRNLAKLQREQGHHPYIITLDRYFKALDQKLPEMEMIDNIQVIRIPFKGSTRYPIAFSVLKHLKKADIVHVHAIDFFYDYLAITKIIHRKKMVVSTHGGFFHTGFATTLKKIYFQTITRFSSFFYEKIIASSENDGEIFQQIISKNKLIVIENGVDLEKLHVENKQNFPPTLMYFGRWSENKGIFEALKLFSMLVANDANNQWKLIFAGRPYGISEEEIKQQVNQLNIAHRVEIHTNPETEKLKELTQKATYFLSLSKFEGFGIAPIEAMSAGLTPVLSSIPPFKKLINSTKYGILIEATLTQDATEAEAMKIIKHYQTQNFEAKNIQQSVQKFAWKDISQKYLQAYGIH